MRCVMVTRLPLCVRGSSPSAGKLDKQSPRGTGAVGEEVPDCKQQLYPSVSLGAHPHDPGAVPQLCHGLDPSLRRNQIKQGMCSLPFTVPGRGILMGEDEDEAVETIFGTGILGRLKFLSMGKPQTTQLSQQCMGTSVSFPAGKCYLPTIPWQGGRYPLPGDGLKSKHSLGRAQETQLSPNSCALVCSLTTSVQLCHPKHRTQTFPWPGGLFYSCVSGPEAINMRPPKTHDLYKHFIHPGQITTPFFFFFSPCLALNRGISYVLEQCIL